MESTPVRTAIHCNTHALHLVAAALLAFLARGIEVAAAAEAPLAGPIPVENVTPFAMTRLEPGVPTPVRGRIGEWSFDTTLSHGNTFIMSDNVRDYLEVRNERRAIDQRDVAALDALGEDYFYVDVNTARMTVEASTRITSRLDGFVRLPVIHNGGGGVDTLIEGFHDLAGFDSAGRDLVEQNRFQTLARVGNERVAQLAPATGTHLGDPVLGLRYHAGDWLGWNWQWAAMLKPSLQGARMFVASGATDVGAQIGAHRSLAGGVLWLAADHVWVGGSELFPSYYRASIPALQAIYERPIGYGTEVLLQANASASTIDAKSNLASLSEPEYQVTIGLRRQTRNAAYAIAFTENIVNFDNSSDIGVHLSVTWRFDRTLALVSLIEPFDSRLARARDL